MVSTSHGRPLKPSCSSHSIGLIFLLLKSSISIISAAAQKIDDWGWRENMQKWETRGTIRAGTVWIVHPEGEEGEEPNFSEDTWWRKDHARWWRPSRTQQVLALLSSCTGAECLILFMPTETNLFHKAIFSSSLPGTPWSPGDTQR